MPGFFINVYSWRCEMKELTKDELIMLWELADGHADHNDDDKEVYETYTALAEKLYAMAMGEKE
jgi:hypothetical protein